MGLQIRDERQLKALTGLSQAQVDHLLPVFSEVYTAQQQQKAGPAKSEAECVTNGTHRWGALDAP